MTASNQELPISDYDELPIETLRHRVRSLDATQLRVLLEHEWGHANRLPVVQMLQERLADRERGEQPSPGGAEPNDVPGASRGGSPAGESTAAEANSPLRHGVAGQTPRRGRPS